MKKIRSYCGSFRSSSPPKGWAAVYSHLQFFIHNSFPDLVSRTWQIHRVSPLWQLDTSTSKLRSYSQLLTAHLAAVCPILNTALTNDFLTCNTGIANFSPAGGRWWCSSRLGVGGMVPLHIAKVLILPKFGLDGMPDAHSYTCNTTSHHIS